jgi:dUTP pyrophosphatase
VKHVSLGGGIQIRSNEVDVKYKRLSEDAIVPSYQTDGAAGFDFHSTIEGVVMPGQTVLVNTGLSFEVPDGHELQVRPRSGLSAKTGMRVTNSPGTIDSDYRGEVLIIMQNTGTIPFNIAKGDRIAQGVLVPVSRAVFKEAETLSKTERGQEGFGHTGVK